MLKMERHQAERDRPWAAPTQHQSFSCPPTITGPPGGVSSPTTQCCSSAGRLRDSPSLSVRPGPSVAPGETVTLLCQSGNRTDTFLLSKEGAAQRPLRLRSQDQDGRYQAEFSLSPVTSAHGGTYRCYRSLSTDPYLLSQPSEPLALVVSGVSGAPGLTWYLSVLIGVSVTFVLLLLVLLFLFLRHRGQDRRRNSEINVCIENRNQKQTVTNNKTTQTLETVFGLIVGLRTQVQAGTLRKPTIWAEPGSVVTRGSPVTIWCQGPPNANSFSLNKEGTLAPWNAQPPVEPWDRASFFIKRVTEQQAGRYHCSHFIGVNWSEPSEPLELLVAGRLRDSPSLSVQPGPSVAPGENVTLLCQSGNRTDTFLLSKEEAAHRPLRLRSQDQDGQYQAEFSLSPVTSAHGGTYRCYRSLSTDPYLLSQPSEPLALVVSDYTVQNLIRMGLAASVLLLLGILLCQARHDHGGARDKARS
ncbi:hypothetical protein MJG53_013151 [Ovis ammon polii x Ovis aries]|uniref:Uncharacterized protein n=1 Tax=Ovis ammon polii x Ovis aries TaxID=2918886 RepID=A0ACB9UIA5_9CETA|nr:hypothetical protein MJG53_013151 [Ovis ammon polii x Ovis aries]